jgi:hypothetical protein
VLHFYVPYVRLCMYVSFQSKSVLSLCQQQIQRVRFMYVVKIYVQGSNAYKLTHTGMHRFNVTLLYRRNVRQKVQAHRKGV